MTENLKLLALFSGCGGKDLGFRGDFTYLNKYYERLPYDLVWANDIEEKACETYKENVSNHIVPGDILEVKKKKIPSCNVVIGGFPCQDFSVAGKRRGTGTDRGNLYIEMRDIIKKKKPEFFVAENVGGLLNIRNEEGLIIDQIIKSFEELKYDVTYWYLNAADFGVPQSRRRVFIVGFKKSLKIKITPPNPPEILVKHVTAKEALDDLLWKNKDLPNQDQYSKARNYGIKCQGNKAILANAPSPTIRAEHHGNIEFHYSEERRLTIRECARLQSFPDDFIFKGSTSNAYKQVGNAVPPVLAWHIAKHLYELYEKRP
ncbi:MAG: DNA cytosine methyltransferase [Candidatus Omnitrophota bacterium]